MIRRTVALSSACFLSACTSVEALRPDMHANVVPSRLDEIAMINMLNSAIELKSPGADGTCVTGETIKPFRPKFVQGYQESTEARVGYSSCPTYKTLPSTGTSLRQYLDSGFGLVDLYCSRYFIIAAETRQSRQMQRNSASALDTLAGVVGAAAGLGTNGLQILNSGFETVDSTYKNIDSAFLIAPDRDDLLVLVSSTQDKIRSEAYVAKYQSYAAARSAIDRYAQACTFDGMRNLVGVAVRNAAKEAKEETGDKPKDDTDSAATPTPPDATESNNKGQGSKGQKKPVTDTDLMGNAPPS